MNASPTQACWYPYNAGIGHKQHYIQRPHASSHVTCMSMTWLDRSTLVWSCPSLPPESLLRLQTEGDLSLFIVNPSRANNRLLFKNRIRSSAPPFSDRNGDCSKLLLARIERLHILICILLVIGCRLPGCLTCWLPGCLDAWMPGCLAAWLPGCLAAWLPGCLAAWLPGHSTMKAPGNPWLAGPGRP